MVEASVLMNAGVLLGETSKARDRESTAIYSMSVRNRSDRPCSVLAAASSTCLSSYFVFLKTPRPRESERSHRLTM